MNGTEIHAMTGTSDPGTEQLNWLSEVASAISKGGVLDRQTTSQLNFQSAHAADTILDVLTQQSSRPPVMPSLQNFQNSAFNSIEAAVHGNTQSALYKSSSDTVFSPLANGVGMFVSPPVYVERSHPATGSSTTLYYSQAPRSATQSISGFFQTPLHAHIAVTTAPEPSRYVHIDTYPTTISPAFFNTTDSISSHNKHPQKRSLLISSRDNHIADEIPPKQSFIPTETQDRLYRLPSGKEGSLKHRILRPPSLHITESPTAACDAPLSAPPLRTPEARKSTPSSGYRSLSNSSGSSGSDELKYPASFVRGSLIQLGGGKLKPVEELTTADFVESGTLSPTLRIDHSTLVSITPSATESARLQFHVGKNKIQITVEAPIEHPFFVYERGWSSCSPERSAQRYGLACHVLRVGDTCISITEKQVKKPPKEDAKDMSHLKIDSTAPLEESKSSEKSNNRKRRWSAPDNLSPGKL